MTGLPQNKIYPVTMACTEHWVYGKSSGPEKCLLIYVKDLKNAAFKFNIMISSISQHDRPHYTAAGTVFGLLNFLSII